MPSKGDDLHIKMAAPSDARLPEDVAIPKTNKAKAKAKAKVAPKKLAKSTPKPKAEAKVQKSTWTKRPIVCNTLPAAAAS